MLAYYKEVRKRIVRNLKAKVAISEGQIFLLLYSKRE